MGSIVLTWQDNSYTETGYRVYRSLSPMNPSAMPPAYASLPPSSITYTDTSVLDETVYYYRVEAFNATEASLSDEIALRSGGGGTVDPFINKVSLLLHFVGDDGSRDIIDSSPRPKALTVAATAKISTDQYKVAPSSYYHGTTGNTVNSAAHEDFSFGDTYTIETYIYLDSFTSVARGVFIQGNPASNMQRIQCDIKPNGTVSFYTQAGTGVTAEALSTIAIIPAAWNHIACVRNVNQMFLFINGKIAATSSVSFTPTSNQLFYLGQARTGGGRIYLDGYLAEFRATKGEARYTTQFVPPAVPLPDI